MSEGDESWEAVWPPEPCDDPQLIHKAVAVIRRHPAMHAKAWALMTETRGIGIEPDSTLLDELYSKSGAMVKPFIDQAIDRCFNLPVDSDQLEDILSIHDDDIEDRALELYTGCVWELTAMLASCIIHLATGSTLHASCYAPSERATYILASR